VFTFQVFGKQVDRARLVSDPKELVKLFLTVTGRPDLVYGDLIWVSEFKPNVRMVNKFGEGRVFVAGGWFPLDLYLTNDVANCYV
jgi:hypothetical protein